MVDLLGNSRVLKKWLLLFLLAILSAVAFFDFYTSGLARRTYVFYAIDDGAIAVENRMLKRAASREVDITRYVEDAVLGPVSLNSLPLFPKETRLGSLLYRDGVVYANFSEDTALPPVEGGEVFQNLKTLHSGIQRNFPFVRDVRFFIAGKAAYATEFRQTGEFASLEREAAGRCNYRQKNEIFSCLVVDKTA